MRVSKNDESQNLDLQKDALVKAGVSEDRIYFDMASGKRDDRPGLNTCLKALQPGNTFIVWKLDRLGRDLKSLIMIIDSLRERDIGFKVLTGQGAQIDTTTANGRFIFGIFASLAEFERELIIERTRAGLSAARARGRKGGRPCKMDESSLRIAMAAMSDPKSVASEIAKKLGITTMTLYRYVNSDGTAKDYAMKIFPKAGA